MHMNNVPTILNDCFQQLECRDMTKSEINLFLYNRIPRFSEMNIAAGNKVTQA